LGAGVCKGSSRTMRFLHRVFAACGLLHVVAAFDCGSVVTAQCDETGARSPLHPEVTYTRTFPKCCKPTTQDMSFREGLWCLKVDEVFVNSFALCIKTHFDKGTHYNALKPTDAMAKIGPDTMQYALDKAPMPKKLKKLFDSLEPLPGTNRTYKVPYDGDKWIDPGDALAAFGQQEFFRFAVGAMPHGARGQGVQDGDEGDAPRGNPLRVYQLVGAKYQYPAVSFWTGGLSQFNDVLVVPTDLVQSANIGYFVRHRDVGTIADLFRTVGEVGTNLFDAGMHLKAMHTDGQDAALLHVRLDMQFKRGAALWPRPRHMTKNHQQDMICRTFRSLLNAPWTLEQLNAAFSTDLKEDLDRVESNRSAFYGGYLKDKEERGSFTHLSLGRWDGRCKGSTAPWLLRLIRLIVVIILVGLVLAFCIGFAVWQRRKTDGKTSEPLLAADR